MPVVEFLGCRTAARLWKLLEHGTEPAHPHHERTRLQTHAPPPDTRSPRSRISHHRLPLAPPFNASWDTKPRVHFDATIVRVTTDTGLVGLGSGDLHARLRRATSTCSSARTRSPSSATTACCRNIDFHYGRCWPLDLALWDLAGKITRAALLEAARRPVASRVRAYASSGTLRDPAAQADAAERYLAQGFPAREAALPPRRLAR